MAKGIMCVVAGPSSAETAEQFHRWYEDVHVKEILAMDGFVSVRRFAPLGEGTDGTIVAIYEVEADDLVAVQTRVDETRSAREAADVNRPPLRTDPPPMVRFYQEIFSYAP